MARPTPSILLYSTSPSAPPPLPHPLPPSNIRINPCPTVTTGQDPEDLCQPAVRSPSLWKKSRPSDPADYRPVALTSHVMKVLERLVLAQLRPQAEEVYGSFAICLSAPFRMLSTPFSRCYWDEKLQVMGVDDSMISWITDYLTGRPQFVRLGSVLSDVVVSDTGAPQGTVLLSLPLHLIHH
ncbi:hypothetical protein L3Q82_014139 [Scortum barcoo]|uniref:Uncharacterized protein n=1 Tax=Scortum barcoo TaxID=214431 RepID=A0ACB8VWA9_9TELE|nr:hypothetical protein L3Q82_014139 [Scortum barcoo]